MKEIYYFLKNLIIILGEFSMTVSDDEGENNDDGYNEPSTLIQPRMIFRVKLIQSGMG